MYPGHLGIDDRGNRAMDGKELDKQIIDGYVPGKLGMAVYLAI